MKLNGIVRVSYGLMMILILPTFAQALTENECNNNAVPRTTPSSDFTVIGDGSVVRHEPTGLEWQRCAIGQSWGWDDEEEEMTCLGSPLEGNWQSMLEMTATIGQGWRMPNINELASIVEECQFSPTINLVIFPNTAGFKFWSGSPDVVPDESWVIDFSVGDSHWLYQNENARIRLVRNTK